MDIEGMLDQLIEQTAEKMQKVGCEELLEYGIESDALSGAFFRESESRLVAFCKANPQFHIVSNFGDYQYNRHISGADRYFLAKGDKDKNLKMFVPEPTRDTWKRMLDELIEDVGPNPDDSDDRLELSVLRQLSGVSKPEEPAKALTRRGKKIF